MITRFEKSQIENKVKDLMDRVGTGIQVMVTESIRRNNSEPVQSAAARECDSYGNVRIVLYISSAEKDNDGAKAIEAIEKASQLYEEMIDELNHEATSPNLFKSLRARVRLRELNPKEVEDTIF